MDARIGVELFFPYISFGDDFDGKSGFYCDHLYEDDELLMIPKIYPAMGIGVRLVYLPKEEAVLGRLRCGGGFGCAWSKHDARILNLDIQVDYRSILLSLNLLYANQGKHKLEPSLNLSGKFCWVRVE